MRLTDHEDDDSDAGIHVEWVQVHLEPNEFLSVVTPGGYRIDVFDDHVRVADPTTPRTTDGQLVYKWAEPE